jgi:hypothetical protein
MELWQLTARDEIRELIARLSVLGDRGRVDEMMQSYAPDASFQLKPQEPLVGREAITGFFKGVGAPAPTEPAPRLMRHLVTNTVVDLVDTENAVAQSYFTVITENGVTSTGRWFDSFRQVGGSWLLAKRIANPDARTG